jgi:hydrogenase nickel incorporation protein HypA/HybF
VHERKVAQDLVRAAGVTAVDEGAARVTTMRVRIGALSHIDPEALRGQVEWWSHGTIVEGASVEVNVVATDIGDRHCQDVMLVSVDVDR